MIHLKLTQDGRIERPDGAAVITIDGLPGAVVRDIQAAIIKAMPKAGYRIDDTRPNPAPTCPQCGKPITGSRRRLCDHCKADKSDHWNYGDILK